MERNDDYFDVSGTESKRDYVLRKRRADLVSVVKKILLEELDENERKILLGMIIHHEPAAFFAKEMNLQIAKVYRIRDRAEKKVLDNIKYVLIYRDELESKPLVPIEFRNILALADLRMMPAVSFVHRLRKLMARECIKKEMLYRTPGLTKKAVDEIFNQNRLPNINELVVFCDFFDTTADYLLKGENKCTKH